MIMPPLAQVCRAGRLGKGYLCPACQVNAKQVEEIEPGCAPGFVI